MKRLIILSSIIIVIFLFERCTNKKELLSQNKFAGEWFVNSLDIGFEYGEKIIILKNGEIYGFQISDGGSLVFKGNFIEEDSFIVNQEIKYGVRMLDSSRIQVSENKLEGVIDTFKMSYFPEDYEENLIKSIKGNSIRKEIIGWWKLVKSDKNPRLPNIAKEYEKVIMNVKENGYIDFYLGDNFDFKEEYIYFMNGEGIDLKNGCVLSSILKVSVHKSNKIELILQEKYGLNNTLLFKRTTRVK